MQREVIGPVQVLQGKPPAAVGQGHQEVARAEKIMVL